MEIEWGTPTCHFSDPRGSTILTRWMGQFQKIPLGFSPLKSLIWQSKDPTSGTIYPIIHLETKEVTTDWLCRRIEPILNCQNMGRSLLLGCHMPLVKRVRRQWQCFLSPCINASSNSCPNTWVGSLPWWTGFWVFRSICGRTQGIMAVPIFPGVARSFLSETQPSSQSGHSGFSNPGSHSEIGQAILTFVGVPAISLLIIHPQFLPVVWVAWWLCWHVFCLQGSGLLLTISIALCGPAFLSCHSELFTDYDHCTPLTLESCVTT